MSYFVDHKTLCLRKGTCPSRAYYLTDGGREFITDWKFCYFAQEPTVEEALSCRPATPIAVPGCWQLQGYGIPQYTNIKYPFPYDPPRIDRENPCGVYTSIYRRSSAEGKYYLNFDGVDSCFYLYVNGNFIGYSSVPHCVSEFDVTNFLSEMNEIRVVVFAFCAGSYLEDQDKYRLSGIFRDVYMLRRPEGHVRDVFLRVDYDPASGAGTLRYRCDRPCEIVLSDRGNVLARSEGTEGELVVDAVLPWTAETPELYDCVVCCAGERICERVGFRSVERKGNVLLLNGKPLRFYGVNRHSMTVNGFAESEEDLRKDLRLIKEMNANAIRTSHYPPHPALPRLCDEEGIYLMEEADVECHGVCAQRNFKDVGKVIDELADDPLWEEQIVGRALMMWERDKNRPSVLVWSLGNESGWGRNFVGSAQALREKNDGRLLHYEGAWSNEQDRYRDEGLLDFKSRMYPPIEWLEEVAEEIDRPLVLCEYTHAMGNSCGDIADYWKVIEEHPSLCGGFVWEWCSHSIIREEDGVKKVLYGGDFGEYPNDGNFCMDGIVTTDRILNPEYDQIAQIYAPVFVRREGEELVVRNRRAFIYPDYVTELRYTEDGKEVSWQTLGMGGLLPGRERRFPLRPPATKGYAFAETFAYERKTGRPISRCQFPLGGGNFRLPPEETEKNVLRWEISKGIISQLFLDEPLLRRPVGILLYRMPLDNDMYIKDEWLDYGLDRAYFSPELVLSESVEGKIVTPYLRPIGRMKLTYVRDNGLRVRADVRLADHVLSLPRFGFVFDLWNADENTPVCWFGRGEGEAYCDKRECAPVGRYEKRIGEMNYAYPKPQECGSRCDTRWVALGEGEHKLMIDSEEEFSFCVTKYLPSDVRPHAYEMGETGHIYLMIDYKMAGTGSNSCGPRLNDKYLITEREFTFSFRIRSAAEEFRAHRS